MYRNKENDLKFKYALMSWALDSKPRQSSSPAAPTSKASKIKYYCSCGKHCRKETEHCLTGKYSDGILLHNINPDMVCRNFLKNNCTKRKGQCKFFHVKIVCGYKVCNYHKHGKCMYIHTDPYSKMDKVESKLELAVNNNNNVITPVAVAVPVPVPVPEQNSSLLDEYETLYKSHVAKLERILAVLKISKAEQRAKCEANSEEFSTIMFYRMGSRGNKSFLNDAKSFHSQITGAKPGSDYQEMLIEKELKRLKIQHEIVLKHCHSLFENDDISTSISETD